MKTEKEIREQIKRLADDFITSIPEETNRHATTYNTLRMLKTRIMTLKWVLK